MNDIPVFCKVVIDGVASLWERWDIRTLLDKTTSYQPDSIPPDMNHDWAYLIPTPIYSDS